jgi:hypothetical protein
MVATQVDVLTVRAQRTKNSGQDEFRSRVLKPGNSGKLFDLKHAENLSFHVDDVGDNLWFERGNFAKIIDKCDGRCQLSKSVRRQFAECGIATARKNAMRKRKKAIMCSTNE